MPSQSTQGAGDGAQRNSGADDSAFNRVTRYVSLNKVEAGLWLTRLCTIFCTVMFFLPFLSSDSSNYYQKCLLCNCITSALRLHQRVPNIRLTQEFFAQLFAEDSAHYLVYSLIFIFNGPISMPLIPLFLYALLHVQNYTKEILNLIGPNSFSPIRTLLFKLESNQVNLLRFIACVEISLMPMIIITIFMGQSHLLLPLLYYRFLSLRYSSRRNPYCKQFFYELRVLTEHLVSRPQCPGIIRSLCHKVIAFICRIAPAA